MIYTVTLNPSIDFLVRLPEFKVGEVNRMTSDDKFPGGKGINVSRILARIDSNSTAFGFLGGFTGDFIKEKLEAEAIVTDFVVLAGSAPASLGQDFYLDVINKIKAQGAEFVIDIEGDVLVKSLANQPLVVKPNNHELGAIYGVEFETV